MLPRCLRRLGAIVLLGVVSLPGSASARGTASGLPVPAPELLAQRWSARWITHPAAPKAEYGVYLFRRELTLAAKPARFVVHVTGDARYRLWVNGRPVGYGPQASDPAEWRYESYDLAPWLTAGTNVLAVRLVGYGDLAPYASMGLRTAFLLQGDTAAERAADTGPDWKVTRAEAYAPFRADRDDLHTFVVVGPGDRFEAARHPWGWEQAGFEASAWSAPRLLGPGLPHGWGTDVDYWLKPRSIPLLEETPERLARVVRATGVTVPADFLAGTGPLTVPAGTTAAVLLDQGHLTNSFPQLTVSGGRGATVTLRYAEGLFDAKKQKGHRDEHEGRVMLGLGDQFRPDGGARRLFAPMDFRTYRYVQLDITTGTEPLVIEDLSGVFTGYPFKENATFRSDDPELARIWTVGWRTARLCAIDTYVDCPYYEQLQYVGDTRIQALISLYVSGDDRLMRNALELYDRSRIPEGLTQSRYPSYSPQLINTFSLFWVDMLHDYWRHRSDDAFLRARLTGLQAVLAWFEAKIDPATGLVGPVPYWTFVDWADEWAWNSGLGIGGEAPGAHTGGSSIVTLQYAGTLRRAAELCRSLGRPELATHYEQVATGLRAAVNQHCWDPVRRVYADTPAKQTYSQHANVFAVLAGAVTAEAAGELIGRVADDKSLVQATTYFRFYLLRALKEAGLGDRYLAGLGQWHAMLARGLTTFAEKPDPTRSDCHAWSASPVYEFLATVVGVEPASPGFATVRIAPHLGHLQEAAATIPHPRGEIAVSLRRAGAGLQAEVTLPEGVTGEFLWDGKTVALRAGAQTVQVP
ncbi:Bacterial alpha-L-rhamnosidase [Lacunisphaera limnophila]|uniref:Bacterial alpha-L-rhamnosidase n=1 Tax=Lacunisphaera limnophila TaxID=1838286 RepID=A0A1I7PHR8_9BACT|nr:alpha-L-rhamnosidase C-terminal domain-containing protein [Lacunisphaera limnophila]AOS43160.1 Bacterial alpha-L-rhamnosidase [Lacunisphaera limnophila]